ncbi:MAG TPA: diacylglycerol kinase family protein [Actinomycetota bacterium]|nr:diacylglycerol kinase family protein [Actinomycetota bacterium]
MSPREAIVVIANPASGRGRGAKLIPRVAEALTTLGVPHEIAVSDGPDRMEPLARRAAEEGARIVAALGGDGTAGVVANGLVGTDTALAVLPGGTGDDFAKTVATGDLDAAIEMLADPHVEPIDIVRVSTDDVDRHFVNIAGAGFDSEVTETANAMRLRLGPTGTYIVSVVRTLRKFRPATFMISVDGVDDTVEAMLVVLGNGRMYGGGMKVCPDASLTDGKLEICVVEAMSTGAFLRAFPRVFRGTHVDHPKVRMLRGARVELNADRDVKVYADGERVGRLPAVFAVVPGALRVVTRREGSP